MSQAVSTKVQKSAATPTLVARGGLHGSSKAHRGDNERVVVYDNQHGFSHRHYFGVVTAVEFMSFDDIEDQFQADWIALRSNL